MAEANVYVAAALVGIWLAVFLWDFYGAQIADGCRWCWRHLARPYRRWKVRRYVRACMRQQDRTLALPTRISLEARPQPDLARMRQVLAVKSRLESVKE